MPNSMKPLTPLVPALLCLSFSCARSAPPEAASPAVTTPGKSLYLDEAATFEQRAQDLVAHLTPQEKIGQMMHDAPAIDRLGIPAYNWCSEALHGVARAGLATVFP